MARHTIGTAWLGEVRYDEALALQHRLRAAVLEGTHPGGLLLLTHPPTITIGRHGDAGNVTASAALLAQAGCEVHRVERGGDVTWHGPGQLVGYPVVSLPALGIGVRQLVAGLAEALRRAVAPWGVEAAWDEAVPGLWVGRDKLAAFGVHVHRGVTTHGFALNVSPDLGYADLIVPCGLRERGVTSLERLTGAAPDMAAVTLAVQTAFAETFEVDLVPERFE